MKKYLQILKRYKLSVLVCPFLVLIAVLCETIQPMYMAQIIDNGVMPRNLSVITSVGIKMLLISIVGLIFNVCNVYISSKAAIGFSTDLRSELFKKIQHLSFFEIDYFGPSSLITRLTGDIDRIQQVVLMALRMLFRSPIMFILALYFVIRTNHSMAYLLLATVPLLVISVGLILKKGFPFFLKIQQKVDRLNGVVRENLINMRIVKSFVREDYEAKKFNKRSEDLRDTSIHAENIIVTVFPVMQLVMNISIILLLWVGGHKVMIGDLKVGQLIAFLNYFAQILMSLMMFAMMLMVIARASASSQRITEVFTTPLSLDNTSEGLRNIHRIEFGDIKFDHISFHYKGGETDILKDINMHIRPGETIAVAGSTGSGKSSLLQLIPRLYDVTSGCIRIDGIPLQDYNLDELHTNIAMVLQQNELFTGTIAENLRWGKADATLQEIEEVAKIAEAHDFITSFTDGYNTLLGRGGVNISGGQKQRICLARALLRRPKILILDDCTSAVDTKTELRIRKNLKESWKKTTVLVAAQRIHTMLSADRVIVLDGGEVEAFGAPKELLVTSKIFQEIYYSQQIDK
ncbi:MAG: ABC transporter ATP-binding protein [Bacteroidaceae bacterium]|nr:ABC transporter ATP-binding protein/permease [Bacteroidaceae bacterium]